MAITAEQVSSGDASESPNPGPSIEVVDSSPGALHVALDLSCADQPAASFYIDGLLRGLLAIEAPVRLTLFGPERPLPDGLGIERWVDPAQAARRGRCLKPLEIPDIDLVHVVGSRMPPIRARRYLLTIHDLRETTRAPWSTRLLRKFQLKRAVDRNARLVATSAKARDELEALTPRLRDSIWLIHSGPGGSGMGERGNVAPRSVREKRWFLTTSGTGKSENIDFLIAAMALWYRKRPDAPRLIWAGGEPEDADRRWARIPARARRHIRVMTGTTEETRDQLFQEAVAVVIPDLEPSHAYEALEAMKRGVPVMCARRRPFTDLLGQAPLWFDPRDSSTLWRSLDALLDDPVLHSDIAHRGQREAARYDWRETAEMTLGAYRQLIRTFPDSPRGG